MSASVCADGLGVRTGQRLQKVVHDCLCSSSIFVCFPQIFKQTMFLVEMFGNGQCCRISTEGKFHGSGCIVNPGLMALLACAGQRNHIPTRASEQSRVPEAITPWKGSCPSFSLSINRNHLANPFRQYMPQKIMVGSG